MDFELNDDERAVAELFARCSDERIAPRAAALDEAHAFPRELFKQLAELGLALSGSLRRQRHDPVHLLFGTERGRPRLAFGGGGGGHAVAHGHQIPAHAGQRGHPDSDVPAGPARGEDRSHLHDQAQCWQRPPWHRHHGDQGRQRLLDHGQKTWITSAPVADFFTVFAKAGPEKKLAIFSMARPTTSPGKLRSTRKAEAVRYAGERHQFGKPINRYQALELKLAEMATSVEAANQLVCYAAWLKDHWAPAPQGGGHNQTVRASETAAEVCDQAARVLASYGFAMEYPVQRYLRDVRFTLIGGGTSEILKLIIAKEVST
jgi:acyl-CoA dehydrogenase